MTNKTKIKFNPDTMTLGDVKRCVETLDAILLAFDAMLENDGLYEWGNDQADAFACAVLPIRRQYLTSKEI